MDGKKTQNQGKFQNERGKFEDLNSLISRLPGHFYWKDNAGHYVGGSEGIVKILGFEAKQLIGKTDLQLWPKQASLWKQYDEQVLTLRKSITVEETLTLKSGEQKILMVTRTPWKDEHGNIIGVIGNLFDISSQKKKELELKEELKSVESELNRAKEESQVANNAKMTFLDNMRLNFRTPVENMIHFAEKITQISEDPKILEYALVLKESGQSLQKLFMGILEAVCVSSRPTGELPSFNKINLKSILEQAVKLNQTQALEKKITLDLEYDKKLATEVLGDPKRVYHIVLELLTRALSVTKNNHLIFFAKLIKQEGFNIVVKMKVEIRDATGKLKKLQNLEKNDRQGKSLENFSCLIPLKLVSLETATTEVDAGNTDSSIRDTKALNLHFNPNNLDHLSNVSHSSNSNNYPSPNNTNSPKNLSDSSKSIGGHSKHKKDHPIYKFSHILLVEDHPITAKITKSILSDLSCQVDIASNGKSAIQKVKNQQYDLILMDIGLPDIDGCEVTKQLRTFETTAGGPHVPIVGLTARVDIVNKQRCFDSGMNAVFSKPLIKEKVQDIFTSFIPKYTALQQIHSEKKSMHKDKTEALPLEGKVIDLVQGAHLMGGDEQLAKEAILMLVESFPADLKKLEKAYLGLDWVGVEMIVHKIRGGTSYCGTPRLKEACVQLDDYLQTGKKEKKQIERMYQILLQEVEAIKHQVMEW
jgi:PAS domain S-box-containing protein